MLRKIIKWILPEWEKVVRFSERDLELISEKNRCHVSRKIIDRNTVEYKLKNWFSK